MLTIFPTLLFVFSPSVSMHGFRTINHATPAYTLKGTSFADTTAVADTFPLTAEMLTHYIACKKSLKVLMQTDSALSKSMNTIQKNYALHDGAMTVILILNDYSTLLGRDTALTLVFRKQHITPQQYLQAQISILQALVYADRKPAPAPTMTIGRNIALVTSHLDELADMSNYATQIRAMLKPQYVPMNGSNDDLSP